MKLAFNAGNFPLRIDLAVSHRFSAVVYSFSFFFQKRFDFFLDLIVNSFII